MSDGARRGAEQGSAEPRSRGPTCGDATVKPIMGASFHADPFARLRGQIPRGAPLPPFDAPQGVHGDATVEARTPNQNGRLNSIYQVGGFGLSRDFSSVSCLAFLGRERPPGAIWSMSQKSSR